MSRMRATENGHDPLVIVSMLQKSIRRNRVDLAGWAACELLASSYANWAWRRICITAAEDCADLVQSEINALRAACDRERKERRTEPTRVFIAKAVILLCRSQKSRDADHLTNLVIDAGRIDDGDLQAALDAAAEAPAAIPEWAWDVHTREGRRKGRTKANFFRDENAALTPRLGGLFDDLA